MKKKFFKNKVKKNIRGSSIHKYVKKSIASRMGQSIMPKLHSFQYYENILEQLKEYDKNNKSKVNFKKDIESMEDMLNSQDFTIAVIANMSSGKSTFINALFGDEVLPAFNEATTDCATYIYSDSDHLNNQAVIHFENDKKSITVEADSVKREIKYYAKKDNEELDDKYKNVKKIDLDWDFKYINTEVNNKIKITFIDTPGPNNTGDFAEKHKDQTADLINSVDMVLFLFDYTQLDANLSSDEQGLWYKLKLRKESDEDFGIYFVLNKIDDSIDDLMKHTKELAKEERKEKRQKDWSKEKERSVFKIKKAAEKHGFDTPDIYCIASKWALLSRKERDEEEDDDLDHIKDKKIKRVWGDAYEDKFNEFLGFEKLENDINHFISNKVEKKILKKIHGSIVNSIQTKIDNLNREKAISTQTAEEAKINLQKAKDILGDEFSRIQSKFNHIIEDEKHILEENIQEILYNNSKEFFSDKIQKDLTQQSIYYLTLVARGASLKMAQKRVISDTLYKEITLEEVNRVDNESSYEEDELFDIMYEFASKKLNGFYRDFEIKSKSELREEYSGFVKILNKEYIDIKKVLSLKIDAALKIELPMSHSELYNVDIQTEQLTIKLKKTIITSQVNYGFLNIGQIIKMIGFDWLKHTIVLNGKQLLDGLKNTTKKTLELILIREEESHKNKIEKFIEQYHDLFNDFENKKKTEIVELKENYLSGKEDDKSNSEAYRKLKDILDGMNGE